ncbi:MAG: DUF3135 domain-containing protein [Gammaproteobacteria bacterium]|nr:DUF3135 domain-containing protein [Gammaproteobacteria bacterium]
MKFDFDEWHKLAKTDPAAFDKKRKSIIEDFIANVPEARQEKLRRLQWRIDMEAQRKSSQPSYIRIYDMMMDSVFGDSGLVESMRALTDVNHNNYSHSKLKSATILNFKKQASNS